MKIEIPNINDLEKINNLAQQIHELHVGWRPDLFISVENIIIKEYFIELINEKRIYVSKIDDIIVGYIIYSIKEKINPSMRYRKQLDIEVLCVDEEYRGRGIGTKLLDFIKTIAIDNNCTDLYLTVNEENKNAIHVYEKYGMKVKNIAYSMQIK